MLDAQAILLKALGFEKEALEAKSGSQRITQSSSTGLDDEVAKGSKLIAKFNKLISKEITRQHLDKLPTTSM